MRVLNIIMMFVAAIYIALTLTGCGLNPLITKDYSSFEEWVGEMNGDTELTFKWVQRNMVSMPAGNFGVTDGSAAESARRAWKARSGMCLQFACVQVRAHYEAGYEAGFIVDSGHAWAWLREKDGRITIISGRYDIDYKRGKYDNIEHMIRVREDNNKKPIWLDHDYKYVGGGR